MIRTTGSNQCWEFLLVHVHDLRSDLSPRYIRILSLFAQFVTPQTTQHDWFGKPE